MKKILSIVGIEKVIFTPAKVFLFFKNPQLYQSIRLKAKMLVISLKWEQDKDTH